MRQTIMNRTFKATLFSSLLALTSFSFAQTIDSVRQGLIDDIEAAQSELSSVQSSISSERQELSQQINRAQNAVLDLRQQAVAARRVADEDTLSLEQIDNRLEEWENQSLFQSRLLDGFLGRAAQPGQELAQGDGTVESSLAGLRTYLQQLQTLSTPAWTSAEVILPNGQISNGEVLKVGPVVWYSEGENAGLAELNDDGLAMIQLPFTGNDLDNLNQVRTSGTGLVTMDPTMSQATLVAVESESILEHVQKGGVWVIPILSFALFAIVIAIFKALSLARLPKLVPALPERTEQALANGSAASFQKELKGAQAELVEIALQPQTPEQRDERLYACLLDERNKLDKWLGAIALTASISPLLGLLGTVSGMITTFKLMTLFGAGDAASVSAGISEALVTTELGLVVAIPSLIAHALMSRKVKGYYSQLESTAIRLSQLPQQTR